MKVVVINGSPRAEKGNTSMILTPFIEGMVDAEADVELFYTQRLTIKPCNCNEMYCWFKKAGECCITDDMQKLYPKLREASVLILATPVYVPLPGDLQNMINRLCPLIKPCLEFHEGRTRARFHENVKINKIMLLSTGGWWEKENFGVLVHITEEFAKNANIAFAGAILRPHAFPLNIRWFDGQLNEVKKAGNELIKEGRINKKTLEAISRPLVPEEELRNRYNKLL